MSDRVSYRRGNSSQLNARETADFLNGVTGSGPLCVRGPPAGQQECQMHQRRAFVSLFSVVMLFVGLLSRS